MISKYLTKEHHKLIHNFLEYKDRTKARLDHIEEMEATYFDCINLQAMEMQTKEAMYSMDSDHNLRFYDCFLPELEAYRPFRFHPKIEVKREQKIQNYVAKLALVDKELELVSVE